MFNTLTLRGPTASINWYSACAASLRGWSVTRARDEKTGQQTWTMRATLGPSVDRFRLRQSGLLFVAPRRGGFFCWPVREMTLGDHTVLATLGPPEY